MQIGVPVSESQKALLERFYQDLLVANQTTNLTRITAPEDFLYRHLLDSLSILPLIPEGASVVDIGSGAGFPAIPMALMRPESKIAAVESVGKKCLFMAAEKEKLGLENFTVYNERSENLGQNPAHRGHYDIALARAVASLPVLLELCIPLVKVGGRFLAMKGLSYEPELEASANALKALGAEFKTVHQFEHPRLEGSRILIFEKIKSTPKAYPRQAGTPTRNPL